MTGRIALACAMLLCVVPAAHSQTALPTHLAAGRVTRPSAEGPPVAVPGAWVVLHRVGSDQAAPLDSTLSGRDGGFRIRYTPFGVSDAIYFVSSRYGGISYFSPPLRADTVRGGDADVIVYETTTDTATLRLQGRHFVMSMPRGSTREIAEIFELENEGTHTVVARDSTTPLWTIHLPAEAGNVVVAQGDIGAGAVVFKNGRAELFAPLSPGVRQLVLTYQLPGNAFPISRPLERPVTVLEVLLEEPRAAVEGARLTEVVAASIGGRSFRRFLGREVTGAAVMRIIAPPPIARNQTTVAVLAGVIALAMLAAFGLWYARRRRRWSADIAVAPVSAVDRHVAELAALDAEFERAGSRAESRAQYEANRAELKARIARALAEEQVTA